MCVALTSLPAWADAALSEPTPSNAELLTSSWWSGVAPPVRAFAQGRLRTEFDATRPEDPAARTDAPSFATVVTGRVGIEAKVKDVRGTVVLGDGGRLGQHAVAAALVPRPLLSTLYQAELALDLQLLGAEATVSVGRAPLVLADGRLLGAEPFDARGRTFDGVRAQFFTARSDVLLAALWLTNRLLDNARTDSANVLFVGSWHVQPIDALQLHVYGLALRDGPLLGRGLYSPTLGVRTQWDSRLLTWRAGADAQVVLSDAQGVARFAEHAAHAEAAVRVRAADVLRDVDPFAELSFEMTGGAPVAGRVFRMPAPTQHGVLGALDVFAADNTWRACGGVGATTTSGMLLLTSLSALSRVDDTAPLLFVDGTANPMPLNASTWFVEADAALTLPLREQVGLSLAYAIGTVATLPGVAPQSDASPAVQRAWLSLRFAIDTDDLLPQPPLL